MGRPRLIYARGQLRLFRFVRINGRITVWSKSPIKFNACDRSNVSRYTIHRTLWGCKAAGSSDCMLTQVLRRQRLQGETSVGTGPWTDRRLPGMMNWISFSRIMYHATLNVLFENGLQNMKSSRCSPGLNYPDINTVEHLLVQHRRPELLEQLCTVAPLRNLQVVK